MLKIIYEDDWLIVVDKPAGLLVIPSPKQETYTLTHLLNQYLENKGVQAKAHPCHRLDRETSGLIIYAKGKQAQQLMMQEFKAQRVKKRYIAFVQGLPKITKTTLRSYLKESYADKPRLAITQYKIIQKRPQFSVLEVYPITGRTNQIRIQLKQIGHPVVGERKFAFAKDYQLKFKRLALHAQELTFNHPITHQIIHLSSELPSEMRNLIEGREK